MYAGVSLLAALSIAMVTIVMIPPSPGSDAQAAKNEQRLATQKVKADSESPAATIRVAVIGDSYTGGSKNGGLDGSNWTHQVLPLLNRDNHSVSVTASGNGGSGYVQEGTAGTTFPGEASVVTEPHTRLVVVFGSRNDRRSAPEVLKAAAQQTYANIRAIAPDAKILVVGPAALAQDSAEEFASMRDVLSSAAAESGAAFVDPLAEGWFTGDTASLIGQDDIHPTDEGHQFMADHIGPHIRTSLEY